MTRQPHESSDPGQTSLHAQRAANGSAESLAWIVEHYTPYLRVQAAHRMPRALSRVCDVEDVINDVWISVMPRIASIDPDNASLARALLKYLTTAVLNRITTLSRKLAHGEHIHFDWKSDDGSMKGGLDDFTLDTTGIVTRTARSEASAVLRGVLEELGAQDREVMLLRGIEQRSNQEVAELTGQTEDAVSKRFCRGLEKVRVRLPESFLNEPS